MQHKLYTVLFYKFLNFYKWYHTILILQLAFFVQYWFWYLSVWLQEVLIYLFNCCIVFLGLPQLLSGRVCLPMLVTQIQSLGGEDPLEKEMALRLQYSCLGNPMDRGAWQATVFGVTKELDTT